MDNSNNNEIILSVVTDMLEGVFSKKLDTDIHRQVLRSTLVPFMYDMLDRTNEQKYILNYLEPVLCNYIEKILARIIYFKLKTNIQSVEFSDMHKRPHRQIDFLGNIFEFTSFIRFIYNKSSSGNTIKKSLKNTEFFNTFKTLFNNGFLVVNKAKPLNTEYKNIYNRYHINYIAARNDLTILLCNEMLPSMINFKNQYNQQYIIDIPFISNGIMLSENLNLLGSIIDWDNNGQEQPEFITSFHTVAISFITILMSLEMDPFVNDTCIDVPNREEKCCHPSLYNHISPCEELEIYFFNIIKLNINRLLQQSGLSLSHVIDQYNIDSNAPIDNYHSQMIQNKLVVDNIGRIDDLFIDRSISYIFINLFIYIYSIESYI